jgi:lycopene beta-cyclase
VPKFFDVFFALPQRHRWAYLTGREDVPGSATAMGALFSASPWWLRKRLVLGALATRSSHVTT